jgi:protein-S-isoprenylcysteine O-methyltransferase Ste14
VIGSWLAFAPVMLAHVTHLFGRTTRRNVRSMLGIVLVAIGFAFAWPRATITTPNSALAPRVGAVLAIASAGFGIWAIYTLGRQWSIQARLRTDHRLVTRGPYRWVRHPVYSCFFGLLIATGLVFSTAPGLAIGVLLYATGTAIRIRSEDALLREQFGQEFDDYSRRTPALIPFRFFR